MRCAAWCDCIPTHHQPQDSKQADEEWADRTRQYEAAVVAQLAALKAAQAAQLAAARAEAEARRPQAFRPSAQYIGQRRVEGVLVKQVRV
jgi:hypothetical protein